MGVAQGIKDSMMVPVETYIDDDSKFVVDTVNNNEAFLLLVSALIKDEDMVRMLQNAPALRPDVRKELTSTTGPETLSRRSTKRIPRGNYTRNPSKQFLILL